MKITHQLVGCESKKSKKGFRPFLPKTVFPQKTPHTVWGTLKPQKQEKRKKMGWTYSILNWYETRETTIELPASLKQIETQILETPKTEKEESHETVQY